MNKSSVNQLAILVLCVVSFYACNSDKKGRNDKKEESVQQLLPEKPAEVTVITLKTTNFEHELVSNGKITARNVAELKFQTSNVIGQIYVKNGSRVIKGQRIASLDTYSLQKQVDANKDALDRSRLEYQDVLISQGYKLDHLENIPKDVEQLAKVKSGYNAAQIQYDLSVFNLKQATLIAPISGVVANLFAKQNTLSSSGDVFCHIIDTHSLEVSFTILENEMGFINIGDLIKVTPFSMPDLVVQGRVNEINPMVSKSGTVQVKASINYHPRLLEGMNVRVSIFRSLGKQWVIPKSAVVLRTGKQVVFIYENGKAMWNYVKTGLENGTEYTITSETLKEGDKIIVSGNISLAHESPVKIIDQNGKEDE